MSRSRCWPTLRLFTQLLGIWLRAERVEATLTSGNVKAQTWVPVNEIKVWSSNLWCCCLIHHSLHSHMRSIHANYIHWSLIYGRSESRRLAPKLNPRLGSNDMHGSVLVCRRTCRTASHPRQPVWRWDHLWAQALSNSDGWFILSLWNLYDVKSTLLWSPSTWGSGSWLMC